MSKTQRFEIQGMTFETPPVPKRKDIYLSNLPKKDQYWRRVDIPDTADGMTENELDELVLREWDRLMNGFWFMNNGEPTYLTGICYFYLQDFMLEHGEYPDYRETDRDFFYFWDCLERNKKCLGAILIKFRRQGMSSKAICIDLYICLTERNAKCGIVSMTGEEAKMLFQDHFIHAFSHIPEWLRPRTSGTDRSVKELTFLKPAERMTVNKSSVSNSDSGLNNKASWKNTKENSYDGGRNRYLVVDEAAKWELVDVSKFWSKVKKTMLRGGVRVGMSCVLSTVNEFGKGADGFKKLWDLSDHTDPKYNGITPTGLYRYFMPAYYGFPGYFDKYGKPIVENPTADQVAWLKEKGEVDYPEMGAREYLEHCRKMLEGDDNMLAEEIRMNPFQVKEAFYVKSTDSIINVLQANQQIERIEEARLPLVTGEFYRDLKTNDVRFMPDDTPKDSSPWRFIWGMGGEFTPNKHTIRYKKKVPVNTHLFAIGVDPYASSQGVAYGSGSDGVAWVKRSYVPTDPNNSDMPIGALVYRPGLKHLFHEQVFLAAEYFSCLAGYEQTIDDFYDYAVENGYENYMVYTPDELVGQSARKGGYGDRKKKKKAGIPGTGKKSIEFHTNAIKSDWIANHHKYWFKDLIEDLIPFDPLDRTAYDRSMAWGYTLITEHACKADVVSEEEERVSQFKLRTFNILKGRR